MLQKLTSNHLKIANNPQISKTTGMQIRNTKIVIRISFLFAPKDVLLHLRYIFSNFLMELNLYLSTLAPFCTYTRNVILLF